MNGFFTKRNSLEIERMLRFVSREGAAYQTGGGNTSNYEFEVRFGSYEMKRFVNGISKIGIQKLMQSQELFSSQSPTRTMKLTMIATNAFHAPRKIVHLNPNTGTILKTEYQQKENMNNIYSSNNNMKISLSKEINVSKKTSKIDPKYDLFRLSDRQSLISANKFWRYDFTKVYQLNNVKNSNILGTWLKNILDGNYQMTRYEFELEYIQQGPKVTAELIKEAFLDELVSINKILQFSNRIFVDKSKLEVFSKLKTLLPSRLRNKSISNIAVKGGIAKSTGTVNYSNLSLLLNGKYAVTEKIDGARTLVFFTGKKIYFIDLRNMVTELDISPNDYAKIEAHAQKPLDNTLLDCELAFTKDQGKCIIAVFDILVDSGVNVTMDRNLEDRHKRLEELEKVFVALSNISIVAMKGTQTCTCFFRKKFYYPKNKHELHKYIKKVNDTKYSYHLDGIVFTPIEDSYYSGLSLKWKPSQLSTIDFLARVVNHDPKKKTITLHLYVGISIRDFIAQRMKRQSNYFGLFPQYDDRSYYFPILFNPPNSTDNVHIAELKYTDLQEKDEPEYIVNGVNIKDNTVIEMAYRGNTWFPIKFREDKTGVYQTQGRDAGNYWHIAYNVWENIMNPITIDVLTGKDQISDKYFRKVEGSTNTIGMVKFHNFIKLCYYKKYTKHHGTWIMELASGRGNDINKHIRVGIKNALLIDIDPKAISEGQSRIDALNPRERTTSFHSLIADVSQDITKQLKESGYVPGQFDAIICNFGIHYVFSSHDAIKQVRDYSMKFLKRGGIFMFSTFDGKKVFDFLIKNKVGVGEEYKFFYKENLLFVLKRLFKSDQFANYGQEIGIYIDRIGSYMNEHLINLDYVIEEFTKGGEFKLIENTSFRKWHPIYAKRMKNKPKTKMSDAECQFSFFYNYVVLQKK